MFKSLKSRILLTFISLTVVALVAVALMTKRNFQLEVEDLHRKLIENTLQTVVDLVQRQYDGLLKYELDSIVQRRMIMEYMTKVVLSSVKSDYELYKQSLLSESEAIRKSLDWIHGLVYGDNQYFFVIDSNNVGLVHPITEMIGKKWTGFKDLRQQDAFLFMRDSILNSPTGYTVFEWPALPEKTLAKQMIYYSIVPEWQWIIGTAVRIDDIEEDSRKKINVIKSDLAGIIQGLKMGGSEHVYIFDGHGDVIVRFNASQEEKTVKGEGMPCDNMMQILLQASEASGIPIQTSCCSSNNNTCMDIAYVNYFRPLGWCIVVGTDNNVISEPVDKLVKREIYTIILILVAGIGITIYFSNKIAQPLLLLARYARDLPGRDLGANDVHPPAISLLAVTGDEAEQLVKAFVFMETELRKTVSALTRESWVNSAFSEISKALILSMPIDDVSSLILECARKLTDSGCGFVGYVDPATGNLITPTFTGVVWDSCQVRNKGIVFDKFTGLWGWVLANRRPLLTNSPSNDPRSTGTPDGHVRIRRFLSVPAAVGETLVGQIAVANSERDYAQHDLLLLERLASLYALAVQRKHTEDALAQSERQLRSLSTRLLVTQEEERGRIARDLHDSIGQSLAAVKFNAETVLREIEGVLTEKMSDPLERIILIIQEALNEVRRIYTGLRPFILDDLGIIATINWFCREFQKTYRKICVEQCIEIEEAEIPESLKIVIFRIVQEGFNNIAKHSAAELVNLWLGRKDGGIQLVIEDNGIGFDVKSALKRHTLEKGVGITGMKERTEYSNGTFTIKSVIGEGTIIYAAWTNHVSLD